MGDVGVQQAGSKEGGSGEVTSKTDECRMEAAAAVVVAATLEEEKKKKKEKKMAAGEICLCGL